MELLEYVFVCSFMHKFHLKQRVELLTVTFYVYALF